MDYEKKYKDALERAKIELNADTTQGTKNVLMTVFPELKESEDEQIRKGIIDFLWKEKIFLQEAHSSVENNPKYRFVMDAIAWLEKQDEQDFSYNVEDEIRNELYDFIYITTFQPKDLKKKERFLDWIEKQGQKSTWNEEDERLRNSCIEHIEEELEEIGKDKFGHSEIISDLKESCRERINWLKSLKKDWFEKQSEQKPILNVPSREVILSIWDLGNEWKELTNGSISTKYGTTLDYIQKHWHESEYYLREKQDEKKPIFNADDWYVSNVDGKIHDMTYNAADNVEKKDETKNEQEALNNWYVEYVYILDYSTGRVIVAKHDVEESISELFEQLGLKESQCHYMVSSDILSIEYINF